MLLKIQKSHQGEFLMNLMTIFTACAALFCSTTFAQGNLIYNGTFDLQVPTNGTGGGWTSTGNGGGWYQVDGNYFFILNSIVELQQDPSVEQTITGLAIGEIYRIQGEYRNFYGLSYCDSSAFSFGVEVDGRIVLERKYLSDTFSPFQVNFVASATEQSIRFSAERNGTDCDYAIDNIQVNLLSMVFRDSFEDP